jgi:hypothetical protein
MTTWKTNNKQNSYDMSHPLKQTKHQPMPVVTNYALMLLKVYQDNKGGYTKKELVAEALGHIDNKYVAWPWTDGAFCMEFSAFNTNMLLEYKNRKWFWGSRMTDYLKYHFGPLDFINLDGYPYNDAVKYNKKANAVNHQSRQDYKISKEIFFQ